jgi:hypothetical protein
MKGAKGFHYQSVRRRNTKKEKKKQNEMKLKGMNDLIMRMAPVSKGALSLPLQPGPLIRSTLHSTQQTESKGLLRTACIFILIRPHVVHLS